MKLHQLLAVLQKVKTGTKRKQTEVYKQIQKPDDFTGLSRQFFPVQDDGYVYPPENKVVKTDVHNCVANFRSPTEELFDLCLTQDTANQKAVGQLQIGDRTLENLPVSYLLFLESQLNDIRTFIISLPELPVGEEWQYDEANCCYRTEPRGTVKTKKITKPVVLYEATPEHPAQVKESSEDIIEGTWQTTLLSSAIPKNVKLRYLKKVEELLFESILAREKANQIEVETKEVGKVILDYIFS